MLIKHEGRENREEYSMQTERHEKGSEIAGTSVNQRGNNNNKASELSRNTGYEGKHRDELEE